MEQISWVFGYGSLMWSPGFEPAEAVKARLSGYARSFCLRSIAYRGTEDTPGLVLGLTEETEAECCGLALRMADSDREQVTEYLRARELITDAYSEEIITLSLEDGREVKAIAFVMQRDHWQYAGDLCTKEQAQIISTAVGCNGPNAEYLFNTAQHLTELGIADTMLDQLCDTVRDMQEQTG